jgi:hypothetical protein
MSDLVRRFSFPFPSGRFPPELGAVVQRSILEGREPARIVVHDADGDWTVADGVNDPNEPRSTLVTHMRHVIELDSTAAELSSMAPGHVAERSASDLPWLISDHSYDEE